MDDRQRIITLQGIDKIWEQIQESRIPEAAGKNVHSRSFKNTLEEMKRFSPNFNFAKVRQNFFFLI